MNALTEVFSNRILLAVLCAWFLAQFLKFIIVLATESKVEFDRLFGAGGMPSSHTSSVCTLVTCVGRVCGAGSVEFAICIVLAFIVMYDASGVRRAAGQHAAILNKLMDSFANGTDELADIQLKELLGHTPLQVLFGALLGVATGLLFKL